MLTPPRTRSPHLIPRVADPLGYTYPDTGDASTPEELHVASWGMWLRSLRHSISGSLTIFTPVPGALAQDLVQKVSPLGQDPPRLLPSSLLVRKIREGRVARVGRLWAVVGLSDLAAFRITYEATAAPILWSPDGSRYAQALGPLGQGVSVDLWDPLAVTSVLGDYYAEREIPIRPSLWLWLTKYGFNPIAEFRRSFERRPD